MGEIIQKPPIFSAIKVDGERAYDLARAGASVEMKSRKTTIHYIKDIQIEFPYVRFLVGCSKGTYIRSLAHDIGQELGVGAYLTQLRRTKIGEYSVEEASSKFLSNEFFIFGNLDYICVRYQIMMIKTAKHIKTFFGFSATTHLRDECIRLVCAFASSGTSSKTTKK